MNKVTHEEKENICTHSNAWYILYSILICTVLIVKNIFLQTWSQGYKTFSCSTEHEIIIARKTKILNKMPFLAFKLSDVALSMLINVIVPILLTA